MAKKRFNNQISITRDVRAAKNLKREGKRIPLEEMNKEINTNTTAGTAGSHASGDRVRPVIPMATVVERRIHGLLPVII